MNKVKDFDDVLDEGEAGEEVVKKKEKKKKSKEERSRDRKAVFFVLVLVVLVSLGFWMKAMINGEGVKIQKTENSKNQNVEETDGGEKENKFFVKYKI